MGSATRARYRSLPLLPPANFEHLALSEEREDAEGAASPVAAGRVGTCRRLAETGESPYALERGEGFQGTATQSCFQPPTPPISLLRVVCDTWPSSVVSAFREDGTWSLTYFS